MNEHVALKVPMSDYDTDFYMWSLSQAEYLRERCYHRLDIENLAEEIESLAKRDRREVRSRMAVVVEHLLKLHYANGRDPVAGWRDSIENARDGIDEILRDSKSLRNDRAEIYAEAWPRGLKMAVSSLRKHRDAGLSLLTVASEADVPAFNVDQALDPEFFPGN